jgi:four helix bundle protein
MAAGLRIASGDGQTDGAFARDYRLRDETEETVSSICPNIAEGFRRPTNRDFARFLMYSYASSAELKCLFDDVQIKGHVMAAELQRARTLRFRLDRALIALVRHLTQRHR